MGGYGSGRTMQARRGTVELVRNIPIGWVKSNWDALVCGLCISWNYGGRPAGAAQVRREGNEVLVSYSQRRSESEPFRPVSAEVEIVRQPCNYGGFRLWFVCPHCGRRVGAIVADDVVGCRHCLRLGYQSERDGRLDRLLNKRRKIESRIGAWLIRPKGMHKTTFSELRRQYAVVERQLTALTEDFVMKQEARRQWRRAC